VTAAEGPREGRPHPTDRAAAAGPVRPVGGEPSFFRNRGASQLAPAAGLEVGRVVGDFRLVSFLGQGGMGQVWEAEQLSLRRRVAVKFVRPERVTERDLAFFAREARAGGRLHHPGIVTVHGHGETEGRAWILMEFVEGAWTLANFLEVATRAAEVPEHYDREVARLVAEIAETMQAAHDAGVIHRDLKPQNVLITGENRPKITDFGLARLTDESAMSQTGDLAGTYGYMSPEQVAARRMGLDWRTDIFSLGIVLYELLALRRPFVGDTTHQIAEQILTKDPPDLRTIRSRVSRDLALIAAKALEKDRSRRFQSMAEFAAELRRHLAYEPIRTRPSTRAERAAKWARRNPTRAWAAGLTAATFGVIVALLVALVRANRDLEAKSEESEQRRLTADAVRDEVLRLSALQRLDDLVEEADRLWPAEPTLLGRYEEWLEKADQLLAELPDHRQQLAQLRASAAPGPPPAADAVSQDWTFAEEQQRWWHNQLAKLVQGLENCADPVAGLASAGISPEHGWGIRRRAEFARTIEERSLTGQEAAARWAVACASIADREQCPAYDGLQLAPQLGLLPCGQDPRSKLWEFVHLGTGEPAVRDDLGQLQLTDRTGLVFVLLPAGKFVMGASREVGDPTYDPDARSVEAPAHAVEVSAFFLSKYELTQSQWQGFTGINPSHYRPPDADTGQRPVEQVNWFDGQRVLHRLGLTLPSEAQWEYGARGGTSTRWWSGHQRDSLRGVANLADRAARRVEAGWPAIRDWPDFDDGFPVHAAVDSLRPNAFGLHHVHGNVWEWCLDGYDGTFYSRSPARDPLHPPEQSSTRVARGGSFAQSATSARATDRFPAAPTQETYDLGLRPARALRP
jgi:formylglycine-generating enzyme required for sulfatase activity